MESMVKMVSSVIGIGFPILSWEPPIWVRYLLYTRVSRESDKSKGFENFRFNIQKDTE